LYFPVDTANIGSDRRSLYDVLTKAVKSGERKFIQTAILIQIIQRYSVIIESYDTTDAGREQVNAGQQVSPEYILRSDITAET
jgi:hypothetical protein